MNNLITLTWLLMFFDKPCQQHDSRTSGGAFLKELSHCCVDAQNCSCCVQWVTMNAEPKFVLKTDDDAYVSCAALVEVLQGLCHHPDCLHERLYFGQEKRNGVVITEEDSKWSNLEYFQLTGLKEYVPYMLGGG